MFRSCSYRLPNYSVSICEKN